MNDAFYRVYEWFVQWAGSVPDDKLVTVIRLTLLFLVPMAIYYAAFINGQRGGVARLVAAIVADGLILSVPLRVPYDTTARAWILTGCIMLLVYIPGAHPFLVHREAGKQNRLRRGLYILMGILLVVGLLWS